VNVIAGCHEALEKIDRKQIDTTVEDLRRAERIFCLGNGGGYAHAMHFASDLRKIAKKQAFSFDNVAEMTARINDDGWETAWLDWVDSFGDFDRPPMLFLFSVGGAFDTSDNLGPMQPYHGIVGANGQRIKGKRIVIPSTSTPVIEGCQSVIAHHLVEQLCS
jgi:hypothetical protein